jgi:enoyl-CoA hydratase/carnithine racemase
VTGTLTLQRPADGVALLTLSRPERLNAIDHVMVAELLQTCALITGDESVRALVLTGAGRGFCAGIDLRGFGPDVPAPEAPALDRMRFQETMAGLPGLLRGLPQPVIAAANGPAVGGGFALFLAADIRVCAQSARFGNAAIRLGLSGAEMGMSYHLPRIVGTSVAAEWMLTGRMVDADEALRTGLVSTVFDDDQLVTGAVAMASEIAALSPVAVRMTKRALQVNTDARDVDAAIELENRNQVITHASSEAAAARAEWEAKNTKG